jgi:formate-dependent nitrite reductase membrane component NrfD
VSFVEALVADRVDRGRPAGRFARLTTGAPAKIWAVLGSVAGLFIAGYTGVLLAVSNQPVWSDTWALGGLFLASGFSGSAALLGWLVRFRPEARRSAEVFARGERIFIALEVLLIVAFVVTLIPAGTLGRAFGYPWFLLWLVAFAGLLPALRRPASLPTSADSEGGAAVPARAVAAPGLILTALVLGGVLALRAAVIFSAQ